MLFVLIHVVTCMCVCGVRGVSHSACAAMTDIEQEGAATGATALDVDKYDKYDKYDDLFTMIR